MWFFIIFLVIPFSEVAVFAYAGDEIGIVNTLALCVLTAFIGGTMVKKQGLNTLTRAQSHFQGGKLPVQEIFDGFCLVATGALLITPGFVTDTIGFLLLIPPVRILLKDILARTGKFTLHKQSAYSSTQQRETTIEGQYERIDPANNNETKE